jgi:hypothetical protein
MRCDYRDYGRKSTFLFICAGLICKERIRNLFGFFRFATPSEEGRFKTDVQHLRREKESLTSV